VLGALALLYAILGRFDACWISLVAVVRDFVADASTSLPMLNRLRDLDSAFVSFHSIRGQFQSVALHLEKGILAKRLSQYAGNATHFSLSSEGLFIWQPCHNNSH
jgi:hypothetical protein